MSEPMTEAERAVAELLHSNYGSEYEASHLTVDGFADEARVAVAAARPHVFEEVAELMLQHAQDAEDHDATEGAVYTFMVAADRIREWAAALRTTTSEEI